MWEKIIIKKKYMSIYLISLLLFTSFYSCNIINANPSDSITLKWDAATGMDAYIGPVTKDIDGDGIHEIFIAGRKTGTTTGRIICINGETGGIIWDVDFSSGTTDYHVPCAIADLDNDGTYEIVHTANDHTIARNCEDGSVFWNVAVPSGRHQLIVADIDSNNLPYVYVSDHGGGTQYVRKLNGVDGSIAAEAPHYFSCYGGVSAADLEGDGEYEILVSDRGSGMGMKCYDEDLNLLWYENEIWVSSHCIMPVDIDGDGILEVVGGRQSYPAGNENGGIYVLDSNGNKIPGKCVRDLDLGVHVHPAIYDFDKDGNLEFATAYSTSVKLWDLVDWTLDFETSYSHINSPPDFANVIGDDNLEMIVCDAYNGQIHIYDNNYVEQVTLNRNAYSTTTQDIDGDGKNEMMILFNNNLRAYDTSTDAPEQPVRTDTPYYSERRTGAAVYVPPIGSSQPNNPPFIPNNPDPEDGEMDVDINVILSWIGGDPDPDDVVTYDVYFGTDPTPDSGELVSTGQSGTTYSPVALGYSTHYYWKIVSWDNHGVFTEGPIWSFFTEEEPDLWWDDNWNYRQEITIDSTKVDSTLEDFPFMFTYISSDFNHAQADGDDFVFVNSDHTIQYNHEIESFSDNQLIAWVNVPIISSSEDTILYLYYGNPSCSSQENIEDTWNEDFLMIHHLNEEFGTFIDSTSNDNDGILTDLDMDSERGISGKISQAIDFNGDADFINCGHDSSMDVTSFTIEAWINVDKATSSQVIAGREHTLNFNFRTSSFQNKMVMYQRQDDFGLDGRIARDPYTQNQWYYVVIDYDDSTKSYHFYQNGDENGMGILSEHIDADYFYDFLIGAYRTLNAKYPFDGTIDEVRFSNNIRGSDWISTCYKNQNDPNVFYEVGDEQSI